MSLVWQQRPAAHRRWMLWQLDVLCRVSRLQNSPDQDGVPACRVKTRGCGCAGGQALPCDTEFVKMSASGDSVSTFRRGAGTSYQAPRRANAPRELGPALQ